MTQDKQNLIWIDLEMTGLDPDSDHILEIATIVTDKELNILAEGPVFAIKQPDKVLSNMDEWNTKTHTESGLVSKVKAFGVSLAKAETQTLEFLQRLVPECASPMCGNSICQDRRFLYREMPRLCDFFHYRNLDVSTIKELAARWMPDLLLQYKKDSSHTALADVRDSINELKFYRENFVKSVNVGL